MTPTATITPTRTDDLDLDDATVTPDRPARAPRAGGSVRALWSESLVFAGRNVEHIRQIPEKLLDVTLQPLMFVLLFAYVFGGAIDVGGSYREYIVGGILVQTLGFAMVGPAITIATDFTQGVLDRFRSLPVHRSSYLVGHFLSELAGLLLSATILMLTGLIVGWRIHSDLPHALGGLGLLVLLAATMVWVGTALGLLVRSPDAVMGVAFTAIFPITFLSNAFVPLDSLPTALQWVAAWNPFTAIAGAVRELFGNPASPVSRETWFTQNPVLASVLILATVFAIAATASLRRYRARTSE